jgi:3-keto-5-aminohexanoate cleavage enzyme
MDPLVITVASTNINWTKKDSPYMPENSEEIAEDIIKASNEGAAVAHIHARDEKGNATFDPEYYRRIIEGVRKHCDVIIQISTGGPPAAVEDKLAPIRELRPHMASLNIKGSAGEIEYTANTMRELEVIPVIEAFNIDMIETANTLIEKGLIKQPAHFELVFDLVSDSDKSVLEDYDEMVQRTKAMFPGSMWSRNRGAYNQFALDVITIMLGGHIRVGLEDNLFLTRGQFAQSSAEFVKRVVHLSAELNRKVASVEEAKQLFKIIH